MKELMIEYRTGPGESIESIFDNEDLKFFEWDGQKSKDLPTSLFKAAPDLLRACEMALSCMAPEDNDITAVTLRAAIAKAEGK